jgi:hypothetical protein
MLDETIEVKRCAAASSKDAKPEETCELRHDLRKLDRNSMV